MKTIQHFKCYLLVFSLTILSPLQNNAQIVSDEIEGRIHPTDAEAVSCDFAEQDTNTEAYEQWILGTTTTEATTTKTSTLPPCPGFILDSFDIEGKNSLGYISLPVDFAYSRFDGMGSVTIVDFGPGVWYEDLSLAADSCVDLSDYDYIEIEYQVPDVMFDFWMGFTFTTDCNDTTHPNESNHVQFHSVDTVAGTWATAKCDLNDFTFDRTAAVSFIFGGFSRPAFIKLSSIYFGCNSSPAPVIDSLTLPTDPTDISQTIDGIATCTGTNLASASWDWGDSNSSPGIVSSSGITGSHNYNTPGVYKVVLTVVDDYGEEASTYQYVVIYDSSGGFVTGGGWINSPEGAYNLDQSLTGKATFSFVSKYKKGQSIPDGNIEFQFNAANMNFKSTEYDWLIVAGTKAMFNGSGTINGQGNYQFILSAKDENKKGRKDTFRIKITNSGGLVYDNQRGLDDNGYSDIGITRGSIIVHDNKRNTKSKQDEGKEIGTNDVFNTFEVRVYPNPANSILSVSIETESNYSIINLLGQELKSGTLINGLNKISVDDLIPNLYFLKISNEDGINTRKIVVKQ